MSLSLIVLSCCQFLFYLLWLFDEDIVDEDSRIKGSRPNQQRSIAPRRATTRTRTETPSTRATKIRTRIQDFKRKNKKKKTKSVNPTTNTRAVINYHYILSAFAINRTRSKRQSTVGFGVPWTLNPSPASPGFTHLCSS